MNFSTTTEFLLLSQKVESIENYAGWIIGGITLTLTILIALFVTIQYFYAIKLQKKEIEILDKKLKLDIEKNIDLKALDLKSFIDESLNEIKIKIEEVEKNNKIEYSRLLAIISENASAFDRAFYWWLVSAYSVFSLNGTIRSLEEIPRKLTYAKESLEKYTPKDGVSGVNENSKEIQIIFNELEGQYKIEIDNLRSTFSKKILKI